MFLVREEVEKIAQEKFDSLDTWEPAPSLVNFGTAVAMKVATVIKEQIEFALPSSYYAGRTILFRLDRLVESWRRAINTNQKLEAEIRWLELQLQQETKMSTTTTNRHMTQQEAFEVVRRERQYQDNTYNPSEVLPSGLTRFQRDQEIGSHLVLLDSYIRKALDAWTYTRRDTTGGVTSSFASLRQIAKIAAIAVRAMERLPEGNRLWEEGLRDDSTATVTNNTWGKIGQANPNSDPTGDF